MVNINAGIDTTSGALSEAIYLLLANPETMWRLREELVERKQAGELSDLVTSAETKQCTYLQAVLYESLRLLPLFGTLLDKEVPAGGMTIGPHYIPAGVSSSENTNRRYSPGGYTDEFIGCCVLYCMEYSSYT